MNDRAGIKWPALFLPIAELKLIAMYKETNLPLKRWSNGVLEYWKK
jgi:hypothetical protein